MYINDDSNPRGATARESRGNAWSGVVALALLAMFTVALIASEADSHGMEEAGQNTGIVIAGQ
ncbi:MAG: hypothetical protein AB8F65_06425 [Woeseiaceae bacterium]